ncbi:hypothetical protein M1437_01295 [Patescibacteria group bacterium]|nr:hypothetical protein [Patescibacteria group bacterium]
MVKLIVLDVDGVIVGHKPGINFPYPNQKVIETLKAVCQKGIPVDGAADGTCGEAVGLGDIVGPGVAV